MKLEDLHIESSPLTDRVFLGTISKRTPHLWSRKVDCTSKFLGALMSWTPPGTIRIVTDSEGNKYEIEVRQVNT